MTRQEILELIKTTIDETFESTPPVSSLIQETTDLLVDIPMFMVEDLDEFLTAIEEKIGVGWGELVGPNTKDDVDYFSKVENLVQEIDDFLNFLEDDLLFMDDCNMIAKGNSQLASENFYSFATENFNNIIQSLRDSRRETSSPQERMLEACISANTMAANLLQVFVGYNHFAVDIQEKALVRNTAGILMEMHKLFAEFEISEIHKESGTPPGIILEFENPVIVKFLHELETASQMLSVVVSKVLEKVFEDYSERQQTSLSNVIEEINMIFSISNDIISYSGADLNQVLKRPKSTP
jgi:hypothetical protein